MNRGNQEQIPQDTVGTKVDTDEAPDGLGNGDVTSTIQVLVVVLEPRNREGSRKRTRSGRNLCLSSYRGHTSPYPSQPKHQATWRKSMNDTKEVTEYAAHEGEGSTDETDATSSQSSHHTLFNELQRSVYTSSLPIRTLYLPSATSRQRPRTKLL